jgi:hypothetical protein
VIKPTSTGVCPRCATGTVPIETPMSKHTTDFEDKIMQQYAKQALPIKD